MKVQGVLSLVSSAPDSWALKVQIDALSESTNKFYIEALRERAKRECAKEMFV